MIWEDCDEVVSSHFYCLVDAFAFDLLVNPLKPVADVTVSSLGRRPRSVCPGNCTGTGCVETHRNEPGLFGGAKAPARKANVAPMAMTERAELIMIFWCLRDCA